MLQRIVYSGENHPFEIGTIQGSIIRLMLGSSLCKPLVSIRSLVRPTEISGMTKKVLKDIKSHFVAPKS